MKNRITKRANLVNVIGKYLENNTDITDRKAEIVNVRSGVEVILKNPDLFSEEEAWKIVQETQDRLTALAKNPESIGNHQIPLDEQRVKLLTILKAKK